MPDLADLPLQERIIARYEAMAVATCAMLAAARAEHWDALVTLEADCALQVALVQREEPLALSAEQFVLSLSQRARKGALLEQMLADDAAIRRLTLDRMAQLSNEMNSANAARKVWRAYEG